MATTIGTFPKASSDTSSIGGDEKVMVLTINTAGYEDTHQWQPGEHNVVVEHPFEYGTTGQWEADKYSNTIIIPIWKVGSAGVTIDWGDGNSTTLPSNFEYSGSSSQENFFIVWRNAADGVFNTDAIKNAGYEGLVHKYSNSGQYTITITGDVQRFGAWFEFHNEDQYEHWNSIGPGSYNGVYTRNLYKYSCCFSSRVTSIDEFPFWNGCEWMYPFILSNITSWNKASIFKGFKCIGGFVSHIEDRDNVGTYKSAGFDASFTSQAPGPFDNWTAHSDYNEQVSKGLRLRQWTGSAYTYNYLVKSLDYALRGRNNFASEVYDVSGPNGMNISTDQCGRIKFNGDLYLKNISIPSDGFYGRLVREVQNNDKKVKIGTLDFTKFYDSDDSIPYSWMKYGVDNDLFTFDNDSKLNLSAGVVPTWPILEAFKSNIKTVTSTEGIDSFDEFFMGEIVTQGDITALGELCKFNPNASFRGIFENSTFRNEINLSSWVLNGSDLTNMFKGATFEAGITLPKIENPVSLEGFFENATVTGTIKGLEGLVVNEATEIKNIFKGTTLTGGGISDIGNWKAVGQGQMFNLIIEQLDNIKADNPSNKIASFSTITNDITLPEELTFLSEIKDWYRIMPKFSRDNKDSATGFYLYDIPAINKIYETYGSGGARNSGNNVVPDFTEAGKYAFIIDTQLSNNYTTPSNVANDPDSLFAGTYNSVFNLGLYNIDEVFEGSDFHETEFEEGEEVTDANLISKYSADDVISYNDYQGKDIVMNSFRAGTIAEDLGRRSYIAIINVDKSKYTKSNLYLRFKSDSSWYSGGEEDVTVDIGGDVKVQMYFPQWNGNQYDLLTAQKEAEAAEDTTDSGV